MLVELFSHSAPPEDPYSSYVNESFATTEVVPHFSTTSVWSIRIQLIPPMGIYHFNGVALFLLPILCLIGLVGNFMVCVAIATDRRLHNVTNYFLFSLALADLLVCCIVMPLSIVVEVRHGVWTWSVSMCLLYVYSDVFLCSASIVHMSVISLDRYLGISQPLRSRNKSRTLIILKITFVWVATLLVSCPIAALAMYDTANILQDNQCMIFSRYYIVYGSTMTFLIPLAIMSVTYTKTTKLLKKQASLLSQRADDRSNGNGLRRTMNHRKLGYARTYSATVNGAHANGRAIGAHGRTMSNISNVENGGDTDRLGTNRPSINHNGHKTLQKASTINRWKTRTSDLYNAITNKVNRRSSLQTATQDLANEHKATRVLAVVFVCFFVCWTPFFFINFVVGFCGHHCAIPSWCGSLFLWLGYVSSTINPIIYTVFNKRFRQAFVRILRCQCFHPLRDSHPYSRNYTTTIVPDTYTCSRSNHERTTSVVVRDDTRSARSVERHDASNRARSEISEEPVGRTNNRLMSDKKISLPSFPRATSSSRDSRATTEDTTTDEENKPLLPKVTAPTVNIPEHFVNPIRKSLTTIISQKIVDETIPEKAQVHHKSQTLLTTSALSVTKPTNGAAIPIRSYSCVDCKKADKMLASDVSDMMTTSTASTASTSNDASRRHLTLFNHFDSAVKETFL